MKAKSNGKRRLLVRGAGFPRLWLALFLPGWFVIGSAHAQLGATPGIMSKMYGPVLRHGARVWHRELYDTGVLDGDIYRKDDLFVRAVFRTGTVELLEFCTLSRILTQRDIDALLDANGNGSRWLLGADSTSTAKYYRREDGGAIAHWSAGENGSLLLSAEKLTHLEDKLLH